MRLEDLIFLDNATLTVATDATHRPNSVPIVANVACVTVAPPKNQESSYKSAIRDWLTRIEETDSEVINEVLHRAGVSIEARIYFLRRAIAVKQYCFDKST